MSWEWTTINQRFFKDLDSYRNPNRFPFSLSLSLTSEWWVGRMTCDSPFYASTHPMRQKEVKLHSGWVDLVHCTFPFWSAIIFCINSFFIFINFQILYSYFLSFRPIVTKISSSRPERKVTKSGDVIPEWSTIRSKNHIFVVTHQRWPVDWSITRWW